MGTLAPCNTRGVGAHIVKEDRSLKRTPVNTWLEESDSAAIPPPWSTPGTHRRTKLALGTAGAIVVVGLVVLGATNLVGESNGQTTTSGDSRGAVQHTSSETRTPSTISTSTHDPVLTCREVSTTERTESSGEGDPSRPEGLIVAYEHAFFAARDAARMVSMSIPSATVATEEQLASSIKNLAVDSPWCVSISPTDESDTFDVAVRFVESDGETVTTWNQMMTVARDSDAAWKIVSVRGN